MKCMGWIELRLKKILLGHVCVEWDLDILVFSHLLIR